MEFLCCAVVFLDLNVLTKFLYLYIILFRFRAFSRIFFKERFERIFLSRNKDDERKMVFMTIIVGCLCLILGAALMMILLLRIKEKRQISYAKLSQFKIQFKRQKSTNSNASSNFDNSIYRDNPTTTVI